MKLKLVVASMSVLGLVSCPAFAADTTATTTAKPVKHVHHHHHHHHHAAKKHAVVAAPQETADYKGADYKGMGGLTCPLVDHYSNLLDMMDQNVGRAKPTEDCNKLISFAGGVNFDAHWGQRSLGFQGENNQRLSLNDAYLNVYGNVNDFTKAFGSLSYGDPSAENTNSLHQGQYSNVYTAFGENKITLEQGFIRFADFNQYPFFVQIGKQFQDNGRFMIHPVERSMTQVLTETLQTSAELGFVTEMGFHGDVSAFDNPLPSRNSAGTVQGHNVTDYVVALGYDMLNDQLGYGANVSWMYNMTGVNDVNSRISNFQSGTSYAGSYLNRVGSLAIDGHVNSGPFSLIADYVTALQRFSSTDLLKNASSTQGAKPWAGNIQAGYGFNAWEKNQNVYLGYQASGDSVYMALPQSRWLVGWNVDVWKRTNLGVEVGHDIDYSLAKGGTGRNSNTVAFRAAVQFG